jgi:prophage antirepressor-like protein
VAGLDDDDEKGVRTPHTLGGPQEMAIVNECRPFSLILASRILQ